VTFIITISCLVSRSFIIFTIWALG
jgi:hypothetical protein